MKLEPGNRWSRVLAVALLLPVCGCISLRGMHSIPKLEGVVVDMETGEPVEGVTLAIGYCFPNHDPLAILSPGGGPDMTWTGSMETTSGPDGHFELPGYWGPEGSCGAAWRAFKKGYVPVSFKYGASRKKRKVWFTWNRYDTSWRRNIDYRWEGRHVFVTLKLEPVRGTDPEVWERYLEAIPRNILLDEAYRYVSQGGELTEGMAWVLKRLPGVTDIHVDKRTDAIKRALLCYCTGAGRQTSLCTGHLDSLVRIWKQWFECEGERR